MGPHSKRKTGTHHTEKYQQRRSHRERRGGGGGKKRVKKKLVQCRTKENSHATETKKGVTG